MISLEFYADGDKSRLVALGYVALAHAAPRIGERVLLCQKSHGGYQAYRVTDVEHMFDLVRETSVSVRTVCVSLARDGDA